MDSGLIDAVPGASLGQIAVRPRYSALQSERGLTLARLQDAVEKYLAEAEPEAADRNESDLLLSAVNDMNFASSRGRKTERRVV